MNRKYRMMAVCLGTILAIAVVLGLLQLSGVFTWFWSNMPQPN